MQRVGKSTLFTVGLVIAGSLATLSGTSYAQTDPGVAPNFGSGDYTECAKTAMEDLSGQRKSLFRFDNDNNPSTSDEAVERFLEFLFMPVLGGADLNITAALIDKNYSPQLFDIWVPKFLRSLIVEQRVNGVVPFFSPPTPEYQTLTEDDNFKLCCVRNEDERSSTDEIRLKYPDGDGWTGMWEYYFPTTITEWSNQSGESVIVPKPLFAAELKKATELLKEDAVKLVSRGIGHLFDLADMTKPVDNGTEKNQSEIKPLAQEIIQKVQALDNGSGGTVDATFSEDISMVGGVTVRPMIYHLRKINRQAIAKFFCMHPDQFMKLYDKEENPYQKVPTGSEGATKPTESNEDQYGITRLIPPFGSAHRNGMSLLLDHTELNYMTNPYPGIAPLDYLGSPTDLKKGYQAWRKDMLAREAHLANAMGSGRLKDFPAHAEGSLGLKLKEVLQKSEPVTQARSGYTFDPQNNIWWIPALMRYHKAPLDRREFNTTPLAWRVAAGLWTSNGNPQVAMRTGVKGFYPKFEPNPYYLWRGLVPQYTGKWNEMGKKGKDREMGRECSRQINHEPLFFQRKPDRIVFPIKLFSHPFVQDAQDEAMRQHNMRSQVTGDEGAGIKPGDTPNKCRRDGQLGFFRQNFAANLTIHRTCPKGFKKWAPLPNPLDRGAIASLVFCPAEKIW